MTLEIIVQQPIEKVWKYWTTSADIMQWNSPWPEWTCPVAEIDLRVGGIFLFRMETKGFGFDHTGIYDTIIPQQLIEYTVSDGRKSIIKFERTKDGTRLIETFVPEESTPLDEQRKFVQAVLDHFKSYAEGLGP